MKKLIALSILASSFAASSPTYGQQNNYDDPASWQKTQYHEYYKRYIAYLAGHDAWNGGYNPTTTIIVSRNSGGKLVLWLATQSSRQTAKEDLTRLMNSCNKHQWTVPGSCTVWLSHENN